MMMKTKFLKINNINDMKDFVQAASASVDGLDIYAKKGRTIVPCTSLMGMFTIDAASGFICEYPEPTTPCAKDFEKFISQFEVPED